MLVLGVTNSRTSMTNARAHRIGRVRPGVGIVVGVIERDRVRPLCTLDVAICRILRDLITTDMALLVDTNVNLNFLDRWQLL